MKRNNLKKSSSVWLAGLIATVIVSALPASAHARARGINQPGAAGNRGRVVR